MGRHFFETDKKGSCTKKKTSNSLKKNRRQASRTWFSKKTPCRKSRDNEKKEGRGKGIFPGPEGGEPTPQTIVKTFSTRRAKRGNGLCLCTKKKGGATSYLKAGSPCTQIGIDELKGRPAVMGPKGGNLLIQMGGGSHLVPPHPRSKARGKEEKFFDDLGRAVSFGEAEKGTPQKKKTPPREFFGRKVGDTTRGFDKLRGESTPLMAWK